MFRIFLNYQLGFIIPVIVLAHAVHMMIPESYHLLSDAAVYLFATLQACRVFKAPQPRKYVFIASMLYFIATVAQAQGFVFIDFILTAAFQFFVMRLASHTYQWRDLGNRLKNNKPIAYFNA
jgi:predicted membrane protein